MKDKMNEFRQKWENLDANDKRKYIIGAIVFCDPFGPFFLNKYKSVIFIVIRTQNININIMESNWK